MTRVSISELKANPASVLLSANDYPVAVQKRNKTAGYVVGKDMFEKLVAFVEDYIDGKAVEEADYKNAVPFEDVLKELDLD